MFRIKFVVEQRRAEPKLNPEDLCHLFSRICVVSHPGSLFQMQVAETYPSWMLSQSFWSGALESAFWTGPRWCDASASGHNGPNADSAVPAPQLGKNFWMKSWRPGLKSWLLLLRSVRTCAKSSDVSGCPFSVKWGDWKWSLRVPSSSEILWLWKVLMIVSLVAQYISASWTLEVSTFGMHMDAPGREGCRQTAFGSITLLKPHGTRHILCHGPPCGQRHMPRDREVRGAGDTEGAQQPTQMPGRPVLALGLLRLSTLLLPCARVLQVKGTPALKKAPPITAQGKTINTVLILFYLRFAFWEDWGGEWHPKEWRETSLPLQHEHNCTKSFPPAQKYSTCSLFSVKSQLVCSVSKASELTGDLKKVEGKGLALK